MREEHDPDVAEDLELLAPAQRRVEHEAVEDLQQRRRSTMATKIADATRRRGRSSRARSPIAPDAQRRPVDRSALTGLLLRGSARAAFSAPNSLASSSCATSGRLAAAARRRSRCTFMPSFLTCASASASRYGRHRARPAAATLAPFCSAACSAGLSLFHSGEREHQHGRVHQVPGQRDAAGHLVELERDRGRRGVLVAVEHAALQRGVDLAEVHRRGVGAHRVDGRDEHLGRDGADLEALQVAGPASPPSWR